MRFAMDSSVRARSCRPADVTPELLGQQPPGPAPPHTRQAADLLAKATNGLAITRRTRPLAWPCSGRYLALGAGWARKACPSAGSTQRVGLPASAMNLALRRDAGERPPRGLRGPFAPVPSSCLTASTKVGLRLRSRRGGSRRRPCCGRLPSSRPRCDGELLPAVVVVPPTDMTTRSTDSSPSARRGLPAQRGRVLAFRLPRCPDL